MRKFILKILIFLPIVFIALYLINSAYFPNRQEALATINLNDYRYYKSILDTESDVEISVTGASHGEKGFDFLNLESEGINCANFAGSSQSLSYDYRVVKNYSSKLKEGGIMFITISIISPYFFEEELETFSDKNERYYVFLNPRNIKQYNFPQDLKVEFPVIAQGKKLFDKEKPELLDYDAISEMETSREEAIIDGEKAAKRHTDLINEINPEEISALYSIINLCKSKEITPILITPPFLTEYTKNIDATYWNKLHTEINNVSKKTNVPYYDYSTDARFVNNYKYFMNSDHLNQKGARLFTNYVFQEVPEAKALYEKKLREKQKGK